MSHRGNRLESSVRSFLAKSNSKFLKTVPLSQSQGLIDTWQLSLMTVQININKMQKIFSLL